MFTYDIQTNIEIESSAAQIWQVLTDFDSYSEWNPMLANVHTQLERDTTVRFGVLRDDANPLKLKARITTLRTAEELVWRGGAAGVISGEHYFRIEQLNERHCRFHHGEHFKGLLLPLVKPLLKRSPALYEAMNSALKERVEGPGPEHQ